MDTFINLDIDGKTPFKFLSKHIQYSILWILIIGIFIFRVDTYFIIKYENLKWLSLITPSIYLFFLLLYTVLQGWYCFAFIFYPFILFLWIIPKAILSNGKIYLFGHYLNSLFRKLRNPKIAIIHLAIFVVLTLILIVKPNELIRWASIASITYFYARYTTRFVGTSFRPAQLFGTDLETILNKSIINKDPNESLILKTYILQAGDDKLGLEERNTKQITRIAIANFVLNFVINNLNSFKGQRSFIIAIAFEIITFLFTSIIFFWFLNFQLYNINNNNFKIDGSSSVFNFLYYTFKTITFSDIPSILPITGISKLVETLSFFVLGIFVIVILASFFFSLRKSKLDENIKLTTELCNSQNQLIKDYMQSEFKTNIESASSEISTIKDSIEKLKIILHKMF